MTYILSMQLIPNIGKIDPFSPLWNAHLIWIQIILQTTGIVFPLTTHFPCKCGWKFPCMSMAWKLLFDLWEYMSIIHPLNIPYMDNCKVKADQMTWCEGQGWAWHHPLNIHIWKKKDIRKVKVDHLTNPGLYALYLQSGLKFWSRKHTKSVLNWQCVFYKI